MEPYGNSVVGVWDCKKASFRMGSFLYFQEELLLLKTIKNVAGIEVYIISPDERLHFSYLPSICQCNPGIKAVSFLTDSSNLRTLKDNGRFIWPSVGAFENTSYCDSTLTVQKYWEETGALIDLVPPDNVLERAAQWIKSRAPGRQIVAVHLKNNAQDIRSNANQKAWADFISRCEKKYPSVHFVLIGTDIVESNVVKRANVSTTSECRESLEFDFSIIAKSVLFMGMSSGPCNFSIMSNRPYLIWKHPGHHTEEMKREFCGRNKFVFAKENQKFIIGLDTPGSLMQEFEAVYSRLNKSIP
jgi:hypothetical protein